MIDMFKAYLQVANGVGELTRQRAMEAARAVIAASTAGTALPLGVDALTVQVSALADDLLAAGRANSELLRQVVRAEVETVVSRLSLGVDADLKGQLTASQARVRELEQSLVQERSASAKRAAPAKAAPPAQAAAPEQAVAQPAPESPPGAARSAGPS